MMEDKPVALRSSGRRAAALSAPGAPDDKCGEWAGTEGTGRARMRSNFAFGIALAMTAGLVAMSGALEGQNRPISMTVVSGLSRLAEVYHAVTASAFPSIRRRAGGAALRMEVASTAKGPHSDASCDSGNRRTAPTLTVCFGIL